MRRMRISQLIVLLAAVVVAPFTFAEDEAAEDAKVCIDTARVSNFDPLSDKYLFLEERSKNFYLITMKNNCFGLRNARVIAFKDSLRRACSDDNFAEIVVRDMGRPMSCRIGNIERVEDKATAKALIAERDAPSNAADTDVE